MKLKLLGNNNPNYDTLTQILVNRNIPYEEVSHYMNTTDEDISNPMAFGPHMDEGAKLLCKHMANNSKTLVICDCDCDGFTAAALLINYIYELFPGFISNNLKWFVHEGKQHGLVDVMDYIESNDFKLVICPDSSSNDYDQHRILKEKGIDVLVLDHHEAEKLSEDACIINNQLSDYPNKDLSGVGVTWQFCRYIDKLLDKNNADYYLDLVALGNTGDMMSLTSIETKHLINKGFLPKNIHNPYIYEMWQKNKFKLGEHITSIDAAFYIVPMINAVQRSGTLEEKELLFKSMLSYEAFNMIPSTKRGHKLGEMERLVDQAVRMSTNVKNRQTRTQDAGMDLLEKKIEEENLLDRKVLLFTLDKGQVDPNIAGLIANKFAAKYQRPCCILTDNGRMSYAGSARGYELTGLTNFKDICESTSVVEYALGHQNAFGLSVPMGSIESFLTKTDAALENVSTEPVYFVDYIYNGADVNPQDILTIGGLKDLWGKDFNEAMVAIKNLKITKDMVTVFRKTTNTLKITLPNKVNIMKFNATDEECYNFENFTGAYLSIDVVGTCHINEWMGNYTAQIFLEEYETVGTGKYLF